MVKATISPTQTLPHGSTLKKVEVSLKLYDKHGNITTHDCVFHNGTDYPLAMELESGCRELLSKDKWHVPGVNGFRRLIIYGKARKDDD